MIICQVPILYENVGKESSQWGHDIPFIIISFLYNITKFLKESVFIFFGFLVFSLFKNPFLKDYEQVIYFILVIFPVLIEGKLLVWSNSYSGHLCELQSKKLWQKEANNFRLKAIKNQSYQFSLHSNLKKYRQSLECINKKIMPFIVYMIAFFILNHKVSTILAAVIVGLNYILILSKTIKIKKQLPWKILKYLSIFHIEPYQYKLTSTNWNKFLFNSFLKNFVYLICFLCLLCFYKSENDKTLSKKFLAILMIVINIISEPLYFACFFEYFSLKQSLKPYEEQPEVIDETYLNCKNLDIYNGGEKIAQNISFENSTIIKGNGKSSLLLSIFGLKNENQGKSSKHKIDDIFYVRNDFSCKNMTLKEYIKLDFRDYSDKQIIGIVNDLSELRSYIFTNVMEKNYDKKNFSRATRFLIDIYKSLNKKGSILILDNPIYILPEWIKIWNENYNNILILTNNTLEIDRFNLVELQN